jgi:hypothetical protein
VVEEGELPLLLLPVLVKMVAALVLLLLLGSARDMRRLSFDMLRLKREASFSFSFSEFAGPLDVGLDRVMRLVRRVPRFFATDKKALLFSSMGVEGTEAVVAVPMLPDTEPPTLVPSNATLLLRRSREVRPREVLETVFMSRLLRADEAPKSVVSVDRGNACCNAESCCLKCSDKRKDF